MSQTRTTDILETSIGSYGGKYISDTNITTADSGRTFIAIQVVTDAVITLVGNVSGITTVSFTSGSVIYGRYTSITLGSGAVIAYQGV